MNTDISDSNKKDSLYNLFVVKDILHFNMFFITIFTVITKTISKLFYFNLEFNNKNKLIRDLKSKTTEKYFMKWKVNQIISYSIRKCLTFGLSEDKDIFVLLICCAKLELNSRLLKTTEKSTDNWIHDYVIKQWITKTSALLKQLTALRLLLNHSILYPFNGFFKLLRQKTTVRWIPL